MPIKEILSNLTKRILKEKTFKVFIIISLFLSGCQIDANRETVRAGHNKSRFITGVTITMPFSKNKKILLQGKPYKDPYTEGLIRQEYSTSIIF